jgi:hypothetical protein
MSTRTKSQAAVVTTVATIQPIMNSLRGFGCVDMIISHERRVMIQIQDHLARMSAANISRESMSP